MIHNHSALIFILLSIEVFVLYVSGQARFKKYFKFIPAVFWIYFLPMLVAASGFIDTKSQIYFLISANLLPMSLFLLLLSSDIPAIIKLGKPALIMMGAGSLGIMLGTSLIFFLFKGLVGGHFWSGFAALSASWTGGSANMIAVKEAIGTPDSVFLPMVIVDTIVPYAWMGFIIALASIQTLYDKWNKSDRKILDELSQKVSSAAVNKNQKLHLDTTVLILIIAVLAAVFSRFIAGLLPQIKDIISTYAWTIIIASILGISLSFTPLENVLRIAIKLPFIRRIRGSMPSVSFLTGFTPVKKIENFGTDKIGYFILYFVLTSIGAKTSISNIGNALILIAAGFLIVIFHAAVLLMVSRFIRAPMFLVAVASQANIGGVASAPIVASIYQPGLASAGLLLAILGNILGTYLGIITGNLCRLISGI